MDDSQNCDDRSLNASSTGTSTSHANENPKLEPNENLPCGGYISTLSEKMNQPHDVGAEFQNIYTDTFAYIFLGGILHFMLLCILIALARVTTLIVLREHFISLFKHCILLTTSLFIGGLIGHLYWSEYVWNHIYYSPDYVVDFYYFHKTSQEVMTPAGWDPGWLIGEHTEASIENAWWKVAPICWLISGITFIVSIRLTKTIGC